MINLTMAKFNVKNPQTGDFEPLDGASQAGIQSDWNQTDNSKDDYIKNKPTIPATASEISYDNTTSHLEATNTQAAIDELAATTYTLPTASANTLGGVKIGSGIDITNGVISVTQYVLPPATQSTIGGIIVGEGLDVDANGTLSVTLDGFTLGTVTTTTGQPGTEASVTVVEDSLVPGTYNFSFAVPAGADGADGDSAYQIWLDEGNVGTEQDFLDSLKADKNEVQVTTTNTQPTDPDVELWVDLSSTQIIQVPEIDDTTTSAVNTWSSNKINTELNNKLQQPLSSLLFSKTIDLGAVTTTVYPGGTLGDGAIVLYLPAENGTLALKGDIPETTHDSSTMTVSTADTYVNINDLTFTAENGKSYLIVATTTITDPRDAGRPTGIAISSSEGYGYIGISEINASVGAISLSTTCLYTNSSGASSTISVAVKSSSASEYRTELFIQEIS